MIQAFIRTDSGPAQPVSSLTQVAEALTEADRLAWVDLLAPTSADIAELGTCFGFHELALEDVTRQHQRAKVNVYDTYYFVVMYAISAEDEIYALHEIDMFVGPNYLVTAHTDRVIEIEETLVRWQHDPRPPRPGSGGLLYTLLDSLVDSYFPIIDSLIERLEDIEEAIFEREQPKATERIFALKKQLLTLRRVMAPSRDVVNVLLRGDLALFDRSTEFYLQDVYDHTIRIVDSLDTYQDLLGSALDAHLSLISNRLGQVMKTLTALATVLGLPTLIASVYGMNFTNMPELHWTYGYFAALAVMGLAALGAGLLFWRRGWL